MLRELVKGAWSAAFSWAVFAFTGHCCSLNRILPAAFPRAEGVTGATRSKLSSRSAGPGAASGMAPACSALCETAENKTKMCVIAVEFLAGQRRKAAASWKCSLTSLWVALPLSLFAAEEPGKICKILPFYRTFCCNFEVSFCVSKKNWNVFRKSTTLNRQALWDEHCQGLSGLQHEPSRAWLL